MSTNENLQKRYTLFWEQFDKNREELSKNNWKLHRKYVREGVNPNSIAKIIRNDEIEKLQEISSQTNFDFNQTIEPSLYERCSFINKKNVTLIDYAAFFGSVQCFKYLLINGAKVEKTGKYAVAGGNLEIIHLCEQNHSSFEKAYKTAIEYHRNDIFKYIYNNFKYPYKKLKELGKKCILCHNFEILSFLEENNMKLDDILIDESIKCGNLYIIIHFTEGNQISSYLQISVVKRNNFEIFKYFLEQKGLNINICDDRGRTPLMYASISGNIEIIKLLLQQKIIKINAKNEREKTALMFASKNGHIEIVKLLLEQEGIDINAKDEDGRTALMKASSNGHTEIVKLLLEQNGIDINAKDKYYRNTALIYASENGHKEIVKLLLEQKGIDINTKDNNGETALRLASKKGHREIVKLILSYMKQKK